MRAKFQPVRFVPVERAFKPEIRVRALHDLNGWVSRKDRIKWEMSAGQIGTLDIDTARAFQVKGYVQILDGAVKPVSEMEAAELLGEKQTVTLGAPDG